jgi:trimethylamine--corrinoid protein Co-methyltransferase
MDIIRAVGPGGNFLKQKHTLKHFRELWQPALCSRQRMEDWVAAGSQRLGRRLRDRAVAIIDEHKPEPLPAAVRQEIAYILR